MRSKLGDSHELSGLAGEYATLVIEGSQWPLSGEDVDLSRVTFETSSRMKRRHGVCSTSGDGSCTIRLSEQTYERAGFDAIKETVRHELVHVYQHQTAGIEPGHGDSFRQWVEALSLSGRCSSHYETEPADYRYQFYCESCGFVGGRHRFSKAVRRAILGTQICGHCEAELRVEGPDGVLDSVPEQFGSSEPVRYTFHCSDCGRVGSRKQLCPTVRQAARGELRCGNCQSGLIDVCDSDGVALTAGELEQ